MQKQVLTAVVLLAISEASKHQNRTPTDIIAIQ
jgi:hypothetical protein